MKEKKEIQQFRMEDSKQKAILALPRFAGFTFSEAMRTLAIEALDGSKPSKDDHAEKGHIKPPEYIYDYTHMDFHREISTSNLIALKVPNFSLFSQIHGHGYTLMNRICKANQQTLIVFEQEFDTKYGEYRYPAADKFAIESFIEDIRSSGREDAGDSFFVGDQLEPDDNPSSYWVAIRNSTNNGYLNGFVLLTDDFAYSSVSNDPSSKGGPVFRWSHDGWQHYEWLRNVNGFRRTFLNFSHEGDIKYGPPPFLFP